MRTTKPIFYSTILMLSSLVLFSSCDEMIGSGRIVKETREVKSFDAIEASGAFHIYLSQGDEESLVLEADDNLMQYIETSVRGGKLYLETQGMGIRSATMRAHITVRDIEEIKASGAVKITGETPIDFNRLKISVGGAADIDMEVFGDLMEVKVNGAGKIYLTGEVEKMSIKLSGASKLKAETLYTRFMDVDISGAGSANVNVEEVLDAKISGAGNVRYIGDPKVHSKISGAGKVRRLK
jgi:hypothetical protein